MLMRVLQEYVQRFQRRFENLGEFTLLLIAPGIFKPPEPAMKPAHQGLKFTIEAIEIAGKSTQFIGIYISLSHKTSFSTS